MIEIDFSIALGVFTSLFLGVLFIVWIFNKKDSGKDLTLDPKFIWFCSVCTYTYINTKEDSISTCPRCGSYNKK
ncbi:MAG: hypothetical protein PHO70_08125 [Candidatus Omnitrophica bacterium]|nr:hypothetical protein [Candidatus Omnitrophota bacterium]